LKTFKKTVRFGDTPPLLVWCATVNGEVAFTAVGGGWMPLNSQTMGGWFWGAWLPS